jgi:hypothetical protein
MTTYSTIPKGPLVSFGPTITFTSGRSKLHSDWTLASTQEMAGLLGSTQEIDLAGLADLPMHGEFTWEYLISVQPSGNVKDVQDELTKLITALSTHNSDGTTGQVGTLTVALLGYIGTTAAGTARLVDIKSLETGSTYEKVLLTFVCPGGFQYTL